MIDNHIITIGIHILSCLCMHSLPVHLAHTPASCLACALRHGEFGLSWIVHSRVVEKWLNLENILGHFSSALPVSNLVLNPCRSVTQSHLLGYLPLGAQCQVLEQGWGLALVCPGKRWADGIRGGGIRYGITFASEGYRVIQIWQIGSFRELCAHIGSSQSRRENVQHLAINELNWLAILLWEWIEWSRESTAHFFSKRMEAEDGRGCPELEKRRLVPLLNFAHDIQSFRFFQGQGFPHRPQKWPPWP